MSNIPLTDLRTFASDIRVGNILIANNIYGGLERTVEEITKPDNNGDYVLFFKESPAGEYLSDCIGIPISEEWLERFSFEKTGFADPDWGHSQIQYMAYSENHLYISTAMGYVEISKEIKFVHEIMNTFYWITGTELTLKQ